MTRMRRMEVRDSNDLGRIIGWLYIDENINISNGVYVTFTKKCNFNVPKLLEIKPTDILETVSFKVETICDAHKNGETRYCRLAFTNQQFSLDQLHEIKGFVEMRGT